MAAQLKPREQSSEGQQTAPPGPHSYRVAKKKRGAPKRRLGLAGWMKWAASTVGLIATLVGTLAAVRQLNPPKPPPLPPPPSADPRIEVDDRATLTRSSKNNLLELRVSLTLLNKGGSVALIPRPTVSLGEALIPPNDLHFKFAEGLDEVIFPVSLHEGANSYEKKIICSIAEGHDSDWYQTRLLHFNLDFRPEGHDPISHCLVVVPPLTAGDPHLSSAESTCFTITDDCDAFGDGFTKQLFNRRTS